MKKLLTLSLMLLSVSGTHTYNTKLHPYVHDGIRVFHEIPTTMTVGKPVVITSYHSQGLFGEIGFSFENQERAKKNRRYLYHIGDDTISNEYLQIGYDLNDNNCYGTYTFTPLKATPAPITLHCAVRILNHAFNKQITILPATASPQPTQQSTQPTTPQNN